jgi:hypothetical protein
MTKEEFIVLLANQAGTELPPVDYSGVFNRTYSITPNQIFSLQNPTVLPNVISFRYVDVKELIKSILKDFPISSTSIVHHKEYNFLLPNEESEKMTFQFRRDLLVSCEEEEDRGSAKITYSNEASPEIVDFLTKYIAAFRFTANKINYLNFLVAGDGGGLSLTPHKIKLNAAFDIRQNYNDDFQEVSELIISRLKKPEDKGLVLLHGLPGTGKTSYIRHLIGCTEKRLIYIPAEYAHLLGTKEFMSLLVQNKNSVIIIEDAEDTLLSRSELKNSNSVTTLLNLSDGLLSDILNIQIICTFNTKISKVDEALTRKGRLIAQYEFKALSKEKTLALFTHLGIGGKANEAMTLSEIYNHNERGFGEEPKAKIGFGLK